MTCGQFHFCKPVGKRPAFLLKKRHGSDDRQEEVRAGIEEPVLKRKKAGFAVLRRLFDNSSRQQSGRNMPHF